MKITTWNVAWLDHAWGVVEGRYTPGRYRAKQRLPSVDRARAQIAAIVAEVQRIDPDVLFLCEAPAGPGPMARFAAAHLGWMAPVLRPDGDSYATQGDQWGWFLLRNTLVPELLPSLLPVPVWRHLVHLANPEFDEAKGKWWVSRPKLEVVGGIADVPVSSRDDHSFFRHPQTLVLNLEGQRMEIIGLHLKSKFSGANPPQRPAGESFDSYARQPAVARYLAAAHESRIKLSSEAAVVRDYIDQRFRQEAAPAILALGDLNDGPGKEIMEREYLLHDLISNLQGEVFFAQNFLNHALFDAEQHLRWSFWHEDPMEPARWPGNLLDHILFTQALTRSGRTPLWVPPGAGSVEHVVHDEIGGLHGKDRASDHRPVSLTLAPRPVA